MGTKQYRLVHVDFDPSEPLEPLAIFNGDGSPRIIPQDGESGGGGFDPTTLDEIEIGVDASAEASSVAIGNTAVAAGANGVAIGLNSGVSAGKSNAVAIGPYAHSSSDNSVVVGAESTSNGPGQVILGRGIDLYGANKGAMKVSELELVQASGATTLILHSPNGSRFRIAVDDAGALTATAI